AGVFAHMLNGLRITVADFFARSRAHKALFWVAVVIFAVLIVLAVILQWPKFSFDNYSVGG
ncbi:MAG: hypothetical protein JSV44_07780, partial [Candidatus Zixiibacteriota bacterium]